MFFFFFCLSNSFTITESFITCSFIYTRRQTNLSLNIYVNKSLKLISKTGAAIKAVDISNTLILTFNAFLIIKAPMQCSFLIIQIYNRGHSLGTSSSSVKMCSHVVPILKNHLSFPISLFKLNAVDKMKTMIIVY